MDNIIYEIFDKHQIRKTKKQKTAFIEFTTDIAKNEGYSVNLEHGSFGARNIVVGDPESAKVIYTAHYDTCPRLPFPNFLTPKNFGLYLLYNVAIVLGFFAVAGVIGFTFGLICALLEWPAQIASTAEMIAYWGLLILMLFGPANKHTANDNTSGVTVLFGIMKALPESERANVAFVFFDLEEMGLIGSSAFASAHKNIRDKKLLINFDCVSDGNDIMVLAKNDAQMYSAALTEAFVSTSDIQVGITNKAFYPSDQAKFKRGVGVAAFKKTKGGMLYMNKIHTDKDRVYRRENIDFLVGCSVKLSEMLG